MSGALEQARAQVESIKRLVSALSVDYDRLDELREQRAQFTRTPLLRAELEWMREHKAELEELDAAAGYCKSMDDAIDAIREDALSIEVRSGWCHPWSLEDAQIEEYRIVLCTGGPHVELRGELDNNSEPCDVGVFYSDGWAEGGELLLTSEEHEIVLTYCRQFYFGE